MNNKTPLALFPGALPIGSTVGIFGNGQLAKMLAVPLIQLGFRPLTFSPDKDGCAGLACDGIIAEYADAEKLREFASRCAVLTTEFENVPVSAVEATLKEKQGLEFRPGIRALEVSQDRQKEKNLAVSLEIPTPKFWVIRQRSDLDDETIVYPLVLKTAYNGYDGRGQRSVNSKAELDAAWTTDLGQAVCIAEEFVDLAKEISVIVVRTASGEIGCYKPFQNTHSNGILSETHWPAEIPNAIEREARAMAMRLAEEIGIIGILAVEMFLAKDDRLLFNEMAPRPHNSGHVTIECAHTSQFETMARAICGLPLGRLRPMHYGRMRNVIGSNDGFGEGKLDGCSVHVYGKAERPGRKLGHVTWRIRPYVS